MIFGYKPKHYLLQELVPRSVYESTRPGERGVLWKIWDPYILAAADALRERYGLMQANDWHWGGNHQFRGYRPPGCTVGAPYSMHRFARAIDLIPLEATVEEIHEDIRNGVDDLMIRLIHRVESGVSWLHIDRANCPGKVHTYFFNA